MQPYSETKIAESDGLVILDEESFPGSRARAQQVLRGEDVSICNVTHVCDVPQIQAISNDKWGFVFRDACMNGWY